MGWFARIVARHRRGLPYRFIFLYAIFQHVGWGLLLLWDKRASGVTAIASMSDRLGVTASAVAFLIVGVLAFVALFLERQRWRGIFLAPALLIPQQIVLMFSAAGAVHAMISSSFADGVVRPRAFLIADQYPAVIVMLFHTLAIVSTTWALTGEE